MRRLLYLAIMSMVAMVVLAPSALAQQGGECTQPVAAGERTTQPFSVSTDTFRVVVDNPPNGPTTVYVKDSSNATIASKTFGPGEFGTITVRNNGNGPFRLVIDGYLGNYDVTVYECRGGGEPTNDNGVQQSNGFFDFGNTYQYLPTNFEELYVEPLNDTLYTLDSYWPVIDEYYSNESNYDIAGPDIMGDMPMPPSSENPNSPRYYENQVSQSIKNQLDCKAGVDEVALDALLRQGDEFVEDYGEAVTNEACRLLP